MTKVGVIVNNRDVGEIVGQVLLEEGYEVINFARSDFEMHRPQLDTLIMEVGLELSPCQNLLECNSFAYGKLPLLVLSTTRPEVLKARGVQADDFLQEPFNLEQLIERVKILTTPPR